MDHKPLVSSNLESCAHDPQTNTLEVKFKSGKTYRYAGVPADVHAKLLQAESAGKFLNHAIKPNYACREVQKA